MWFIKEISGGGGHYHSSSQSLLHRYVSFSVLTQEFTKHRILHQVWYKTTDRFSRKLMNYPKVWPQTTVLPTRYSLILLYCPPGIVWNCCIAHQLSLKPLYFPIMYCLNLLYCQPGIVYHYCEAHQIYSKTTVWPTGNILKLLYCSPGIVYHYCKTLKV